MRLKRALLRNVLLPLTIIGGWTNASAETPANWKDSGFSINADGMSLRKVLAEFGQAYDVRVVSSIHDQVILKRRLKADTGSAFLDHLTHEYQFQWFVYAGVLYIVPQNEYQTARIAIGEDAVQDAKAALTGVGLFESKFGWGELPDQGVIFVNGPKEYVKLVRETLLPEKEEKGDASDTKHLTFNGKQMMIFRLKYANAMDRVIMTRGQKETIPGVKKLLRELFGAETTEVSAGDNQDRFDVGSARRSRTKSAANEASPAQLASAPYTDQRGDGNEAGSGRQHTVKPRVTKTERPYIDADASLNAIIIYDVASKRPMYEQLISELDVERQQIEIEALIVDIDRNKLLSLGLEWGIQTGNSQFTMNATGDTSNGATLPVPGSTMLINNFQHFYARLKALENSGDANIIAKPTVLTINNVAAVLDLSQTLYVPLIGERTTDLANITAGTMLRVVPRILNEGGINRVHLNVDIEDGNLGDTDVKSKVTRSTISTQAIIDVQQTLMIGGYHVESTEKIQNKVPGLSDIPLIGGLFRSNSDSVKNHERLFLITPRLTNSLGMTAPPISHALKLSQNIMQLEKAKIDIPNNDVAEKTQPSPAIQNEPPKDMLRKIEFRDSALDDSPRDGNRKRRCVKPEVSLGSLSMS